MSLTREQVTTVADLIRTAPTLHDAAAWWRERYPAVRAMRIDAADMRDEKPALTAGARSVYFATSGGMCVSVTQRADEADMLIFSEHGAGDGAR
jgi:hypothetical protein